LRVVADARKKNLKGRGANLDMCKRKLFGIWLACNVEDPKGIICGRDYMPE
jgi:hypothetical protein